MAQNTGFDWQSLTSSINDTFGIASNIYATSQGQAGGYSPTPGIAPGGGVVYVPTPAQPTQTQLQNNTILWIVIAIILLVVVASIVYLIASKK